MDGLTSARIAPGGVPRVAALDGLRGLACLLVVLWHYANVLHYDALPLPVRGLLRGLGLSWSGVDLFFVLSGFLLGGICLRHRRAPNFFAVFYARRIFRIFPLYFVWIVLWLTLPLLAAPAISSVTVVGEPAWPYAAFVQNWYFALRGAYGSTWMAVTWSLAVEEQFYLLLPALVRWVPPSRLGAVLLVLIVTAPLARAAVIFGLPASSAMAAYWLLPCRWDALFLGVLAALWTQRPEGAAWASRHLPAFKLYATCAAAALLGLLVVAPDKRQPLNAVLGFSLIDLFFAVLVVLARFDTKCGRLLSWRPLTWLGSISFGVYLFHLGFLSLLLAVFQIGGDVHDGQGLAIVFVAAPGTVALAWLSFRFFESPLVRIGQRWQYAGAGTSAPLCTIKPRALASGKQLLRAKARRGARRLLQSGPASDAGLPRR
jgi:peptidoglycan/LPS O-acetylase OafA/YrhL